MITKDRSDPLAKQQEVAAAHDRSVIHAVNLKLTRKGDCQMLNSSVWEAWQCCTPSDCGTRPHRVRFLHRWFFCSRTAVTRG